MELPFIVFISCFLYQISPGACAASSEHSEQETSDEQDRPPRMPLGTPGNVITLTLHDKDNPEFDPEYTAEKKAGDPSDTFGSNQHRSYPFQYNDLGRRFVPVYPYTEKKPSNTEENIVSEQKSENEELLPVEATPEKVLAVAMKSARDQASMPINNSEVLKNEKDILRTGDYWNAVWVEDVDPKSVLRSYTRNQLVQEKQKHYRYTAPKLGSVRAKIMPGSKLYQLVSVLQQFSPRLLYVINKDQ